MPETAFIAFGSNMGNGEENIRAAWDALALVPGVETEALSRMYVTKPWGYTEQADFTNACGRVRTSLSPEALLGVCLGIEAGMGRVRLFRNGPRIVDLDLLLYDGETRRTAELTLPHPGLLLRDFVLRPLLDVAPDGFALGLDVSAALADLSRNKNAEKTLGPERHDSI